METTIKAVTIRREIASVLKTVATWRVFLQSDLNQCESLNQFVVQRAQLKVQALSRIESSLSDCLIPKKYAGKKLVSQVQAVIDLIEYEKSLLASESEAECKRSGQVYDRYILALRRALNECQLPK